MASLAFLGCICPHGELVVLGHEELSPMRANGHYRKIRFALARAYLLSLENSVPRHIQTSEFCSCSMYSQPSGLEVYVDVEWLFTPQPFTQRSCGQYACYFPLP